MPWLTIIVANQASVFYTGEVGKQENTLCLARFSLGNGPMLFGFGPVPHRAITTINSIITGWSRAPLRCLRQNVYSLNKGMQTAESKL